jgi:MarR family transcriptional regulator for hemolysin
VAGNGTGLSPRFVVASMSLAGEPINFPRMSRRRPVEANSRKITALKSPFERTDLNGKRMKNKFAFGVLVHEVSRMRRKAIDHVLKPMGVTGAQWWVITYLSLHPGLSQVDLAEELNMGKVPLGGLVDRLEKIGLIERRSDPVDRRVNRIYLNKAGIELVKDIKTASEGVQDKALYGITSEELNHAIAALGKMEANLRELLRKI